MHVQRYLCRRVHYGPSGPSVYVDGGDRAGVRPGVRGAAGVGAMVVLLGAVLA